MQRLFSELKNFVFKNLMAFVVLAVSLFLLVLVLLWVTLLALWLGNSFTSPQLAQMTVLVCTVLATIAVVVIVLWFVNRARLDRAKAAAAETELAKNLVVVNNYRQAVLDYEAARNGKR
jgi:membrane protein implicated in regulation of membrane protease activity